MRSEGRFKIYDLNQLRSFMEVARWGSFTAAAAHLRLSTAAVSRSIARLEQEVDSRLFNRNTRRLNLTEDGRIFLAQVTESIEKLANAKDLLRQGHGSVAGTLKVLLPNAFCKHYVMHDLPSLLKAHPALSIDLYVEDYCIDLLRGGFEVAVQIAEPSAIGYIHRRLGAMRVVLVASPEYLRQRGTPREINDLDLHDCINVRNSTGSGGFNWQFVPRSAGEKPQQVVYRPNGRFFVNSQLDAAIHAAVCGIGVTPCDVEAARQYLENGMLKVVLPAYELAHAGELFLLYPHRDHLPMRVRTFIEFLVDVAQRRLLKVDFEPHNFAA